VWKQRRAFFARVSSLGRGDEMTGRSKNKHGWRIAVLLAASVVGTACGGDGSSASDSKRIAQRPAATSSQSSGEVTLAGDSAPSRVRWIGDENILALTILMNSRIRAAANYELQLWGSDTTRALAAEMSRQHADIRYTLDSIATALNMAPVLPALAADVDSATRRHVDALTAVEGGRPLDRAYVRSQIASHELMIDYLAKFSAAAQRDELRRVIDSINAKLKVHLAQGRALRAQFANADSAKAVRDSVRRARLRRP
jgi:predicted outer membrane protein